MKRSVTILISAGTGLALLAGGTAAGAAIAGGPVDGSGMIHGCYTNKAFNGSHVFVLQDAGTTCPNGTTAVEWNQQGQAGPAGPQGPAGNDGAQGPAGPAGPVGPSTAGPSGLDAIVVNAHTPAGGSEALASCPSDHPYLLGGGVDSGEAGTVVVSRPDDNGGGSGGQAIAGPEAAGQMAWMGATTGLSSVGIWVYAICAK